MVAKDLLTCCTGPSPAARLLLLPLTAFASSSLNFPRVFHRCVLAGVGGSQLFRFLIHLHVAALLYLVGSANASTWADIWAMFFMRETQMTSLMSPVDDCATLTERLQLLSVSVKIQGCSSRTCLLSFPFLHITHVRTSTFAVNSSPCRPQTLVILHVG